MNIYLKPWVAMLLMLLPTTATYAAVLTTISTTGSSTNRIDVIIVSEGYTASQEPLFNSDVQEAMDAVVLYQPFDAYSSHFNFYSIFEPSNESGADDPIAGIDVDTAFDATYACNGLERLLCANNNAVNAVVSSVANAAQRDAIVLLVNDPGDGGSGGQIAVVSTGSPMFAPTVAHELGHSFGGLADEYEDAYENLNSCDGNIVEPAELNVTSSLLQLAPPSQIKWNDSTPGKGGSPWLGQLAGSHQPTTNTQQNEAGLYEGAYYCDQYFYRPTFNSLMRAETQRFDVVNEEILTRVIHDYVSPIDSNFPTVLNINVIQGTQREFFIQPLSGQNGNSIIQWTLDGTLLGTQPTQVLDAANLAAGTYTLEVSVTESTYRVRRDLLGQMKDSVTWNVTVVP